MRRLTVVSQLVLVLGALVVVSGCNHAGPRGLRSGRVLYNEAVSLTNNEQILLNLVRLRYRDNPMFLEVTSISTQYQLSGSGSLSVSGSPDDGVEGLSSSLGISYAEKPTISFAPLQGEKFVTQLLSPIEPETAVLLLHSGWRIDRVMRCLVQGLNGVDNAHSASSPTPSAAPRFKEFKRVTELLRELQKRGQLEIGLTQREDGSTGLSLRVAPEAKDSEQMQEVARILGVEPGQNPYEILPGVLGGSRERIVVNMRSLIGVLFFLSQGVEVPPEHEERGLVTVTRTESGERFDWGQVSGDMLRIQWSKQRPDDAAVCVKYRGVWFYLADTDLMSKSTFTMLDQLIALQAGGTPTASPVLTLPLG